MQNSNRERDVRHGGFGIVALGDEKISESLPLGYIALAYMVRGQEELATNLLSQMRESVAPVRVSAA